MSSMSEALHSFLFTRDNATHPAVICSMAFSETALAQAKESALLPQELDRISGYRSAKRQDEAILGCYTAKRAVADLLGMDTLTEIYVEKGVFGQPVVQVASARPVQVSLSHTKLGAIAIAGFAGHPVGIDMETLNAKRSQTIFKTLTVQEKALLLGHDEATLLPLIWTAKEALSKVIQTGLSIPMAQLALEHLHVEQGQFQASFANFTQYRAQGFVQDTLACSLVCPKNSQLLESPFPAILQPFA